MDEAGGRVRVGLHSAFAALAPPAVGEGRLGRHLRLAVLRAMLPLLVRRHHLADLLVLLGGARTGPAIAEDGRRVLASLRARRMTCLHRALAGYAALRGRGEDVRFVIGVRPDSGELTAHAWLERDGAPLGDEQDPRSRFAVAFVHPAPNVTPEEDQMPRSGERPDVILTELQDGTGVLLHLGTKFYYALNRTGVAAWKILASGEASSPEEIGRVLAERFAGVTEEDARRDVEELFAELRAEDLLPRKA